jgi:hypothetical protein
MGHCAPYWRIDAVANGLIPLVGEQILKETACELMIACHYQGSIAIGIHWALSAKKAQTQNFDENTVITVRKNGGQCCAQ